MTHEDFVGQIRAAHPIRVSIDLTGATWLDLLVALDAARRRLMTHHSDAVGATSQSTYVTRVHADDTRRPT